MRLDIGLLLARLAFGGSMLFNHGLGKLMSFKGMAATFPDPIGLGSKVTLCVAIFCEVFCAALVVIGLSTRLATLPLIGTMLVAFFIVHAADPWTARELAFMYGVGFAVIFCTGPGAFSADGFLRLKRTSRP